MRMLFFAIVVVGCFTLVIPGFATEAKLDSSSASILDESTEETRLDYSNFPIDDLAEEVPLYFEPVPEPPDFTEVEIPVGGQDTLTMSVAWGDYDNDSDLDLAVANVGEAELYINDSGQLALSDTFNPLGAGGDLTSVAWGDYDNDGDLDLAVGDQNEMLVDYLFTNMLGSSDPDPFAIKRWFGPRRNLSMAWGDYDNDGDIDLAVSNTGGGDIDYFRENCLYINRCTGNFRAITEFGTGSFCFAWGDYDHDGDLDLAVGNYFNYEQKNYTGTQNYLYVNNGDGTFSSPQAQFGTGLTHSAAWGDFDNDGDLDLAVGNNGVNYLYINNGDGTFEESLQFNYEEEFLQTTSVAWGDYDNDGDLDLAVGNFAHEEEREMVDGQNYLFINNLGEEKESLFTGELQFGDSDTQTRSVVWGDFDNDGDLDLAVGNKAEGVTPQQNYLYVNNLDNNNGFIGVHLVGHYHDEGYGFSNRDGIGAKVMVYERGHLKEPDYLIGFREINANEGGGGMDSLDAEFGIPGPEVPIFVDVLVEWPGSNGIHIEEFWILPTGQYYTLEEGSGLPPMKVSVLSSTVQAPNSFSISALYPNPASDMLTCLLAMPEAGAVELTLYDLSGRLVLKQQLEVTEPTELEAILDVSGLASGVYTLRASSGGAEVSARTVIVR